MFPSFLDRWPGRWAAGVVPAGLLSFTAVSAFTAVLGLGFLPHEAQRLNRPPHVSVTHCLPPTCSRPLTWLAWSLSPGAADGWRHSLWRGGATPSGQLAAGLWPELSPTTIASGPGEGDALIGGWGGELYWADLQQPRSAPQFVGRHTDGGVVGIASAVGERRAVSHGPRHLCAWDVPTSRLMWRREELRVECAALLASSGIVYSALRTGEVLEIELATGRTLRVVARLTPPCGAIAVSADGRRLAAQQWDGRAHVWNLDGTPLAWPGNGLALSAKTRGTVLALSADGKRLATTATDDPHALRLWDVEAALPLAGEPRHDAAVLGAAFASSGALYSWGLDGTIRVWNGTPSVVQQVIETPRATEKEERPAADGLRV